MVISSSDPPRTFSDRTGARKSSVTAPSSIRPAAAVRDSPNIREMATSSRSPASPSGTGSSRGSATAALPMQLVRLRLRLALAGQVDAEQRDQYGKETAGHDAGVGDVEDRPDVPIVGEQRDPVDHVAPARRRAAEEPVDQVAHRTAEHQPECDGP